MQPVALASAERRQPDGLLVFPLVQHLSVIQTSPLCCFFLFFSFFQRVNGSACVCVGVKACRTALWNHQQLSANVLTDNFFHAERKCINNPPTTTTPITTTTV